MKYLITLLMIITTALPAVAQQKVVELERCACSSGTASRNKEMIEREFGSNVTLKLPPGKYSSESLTLSGLSNFTLAGTEDPTTGEVTTIKMNDSTGINLTRVTNIRLENLTIEGKTASNLVVLSSASDLSAENLNLSENNDETLYSDCLQINLDWLVPVISLVMF